MRVSLFTTCLIDQLFPQVGVAVVDVLTELGLSVDYDRRQSCCAQPAFNSGYPKEAARVFRRQLEVLEGSEAVLIPSGSCSAMLRKFGPGLFEPGTRDRRLAEDVAQRVYEFSEFLVDILKTERINARFPAIATFHDSCHQLRELGISRQPRILLQNVEGLEFRELPRSDRCCGFGGTFSLKFDDVSAALGQDKVKSIEATGAEYVVSTDVGCLMHLEGLIKRHNLPIRTIHLAEILATRKKDRSS